MKRAVKMEIPAVLQYNARELEEELSDMSVCMEAWKDNKNKRGKLLKVAFHTLSTAFPLHKTSEFK